MILLTRTGGLGWRIYVALPDNGGGEPKVYLSQPLHLYNCKKRGRNSKVASII